MKNLISLSNVYLTIFKWYVREYYFLIDPFYFYYVACNTHN